MNERSSPVTCDVCRGEGKVAYIQSAGGFSEPADCYKCGGTGDARFDAIMGAVRSHMHDHTSAYAITKSVLATLRSPDAAATPQGAARLWQERAPHGPWFVHTPYDEDIFFGGDLASAQQCLRALNRTADAAQPLGVDAVELRGHLIETCASICKVMREKHSSPVGDAYANGGWDQGVRIEQAIRGLAAALALPSTNHSSPAATTGDTPSGSRPPASAAMGHCAGGEAPLKCIPCSGTGRYMGRFGYNDPDCPNCNGTGWEDGKHHSLTSPDRPPGNPEKEERERLDRWGIGK